MNKRLFSMFLALCMIVSMLPVSAMAEEIHTTVGGSGEIISFAPLTETEKTVSPGKSGEDLELPETLTATVRTAVPADENPVQDSGSPQTATPATTTEPEWVENTVEIPVTWVSLDYDMNTEGEYVFTPVVEGYTVSVPLPEIVVTVGEVPPIAAARGLATPMSTTNYGIWVGGVEVTSANKDNIAGMGITGNVTYDSDTNTLTLNDANITGCYTAGNYDYGIYHSNSSMVNNLIINLVGTNTITLNARELQTVAGIYSEQSEGSLTFCETGSGSLSISAPNMAIYGENAITISSGTINATGGPVGIYSRGQMTINGGNVTAGGTSYGIGCNNSLSITSGTLTATSGTHAIVFTDGSLSASDGMQVTASANENGTNQETYNAANLANYKYIKVEPGATSSVPTEVGDRTALQSAISDAAGDLNLKLSDSYSDTGTITIPSTFIHNITIDLNGKTLNGGSAAAITHQGDGTLTITDSSSGGTVTSTTNSQGTIAVVNGGTVELLGGTVSNSNSAGGAAVYTQNATLNIRGGVVSAAGDGGVAVWDSSSSILNIYGGMLSAAGSSGNAVYSTNVDSRLNISGGTISAASNIAIYHQNTTIKTGTIIIQGGTKAMQSAPTLESGVQGMASTNIDGNDSVAYNVADLATYKYIKVEPAAVTPVPTVTSVSVPTYDTYLSGENLNFTVTFDKNVTVNTSSGTPYLSLTIGSASRHADYVSGSGTNLVFRYTVQAGDSDTNGISIDSLTLNGGTIQDSTGNDANLTLNGVGDVTGVLVNPPAPSISVQPSPQTVNEGQSATFSVTATGTGLTYQWQVNTGSNFTTITDGGVYSGASTSTLNITRATAGMNGYLYRIVVIGTYSPIATSNSARLTVNAAPSYTITANPTTKDFGSLSAGYSAPAAQTVTITNTGNSSLTLTQPTSTNYTIGALSTTALAANGTATFTVAPKTGLAVGAHNETLTVSTNHSTSATVELSFEVTAAPTYTITADPVTKDFGSLTIGYVAPAAQTVTITNTGNSSLTLTQPTSTNYTIGALSTTALAANGTATFTVAPKTGLAVGAHNETLTVSTNHSTSATVELSFEVTAAPTYTITADPVTKDFGSLTIGYVAPAAQTVTITNTGNSSLTLTQPTSINYTIGALSTTALAANGTATFTVAPKTGLAVGAHNETLTVSTNHSTSATVELSFEVTAAPTYTITADPVTKDFGSLTIGYVAPAAQTVTITNTGNSSLTLTQPTSTNYTIGALSTTSLAANGTATFTVAPKTGLAVGAHNETLTVSTNHSTSATVELSFTVTAAPTYTITANPTSKNFGSLAVGYSAPAAQTVTITNTGNSSVTLTQPSSTNYTIGALSTTTLAAGGTATFTVAPKAGLAVGAHNETLTVSTNHSTSATVALSFAVTAVPTYTITANPTSKNFGSLTVGYSAPAAQTVTITNTGNSSVTLTQLSSTNYTIGTLSTTALAANGTATFTVTPKTDLAVGNYNETLTVSTDHSTSATVALSFAVTAAPTYTITADPVTKDFGSLTIGYVAPAAQTVTITNTGNSSLTLTQPTSTNYTIGALSTTALAANGTATFTVTPKTDLAVGNYNETLTVSTDHSTNATIELSFSVTAVPDYTVTFNPNGGTVSETTRSVVPGTAVGALPTPTRSGSYSFDGWYTAASGGTQISAGTTVSANVTYYAHWTYTGGGGSGGGGGSSSNDNSSPVIVTPPAPDKPNSPTQGEIKVPGTVDGKGNVTVSLTDKTVTDAFNKALAEAKKNGTEQNGITVVLRVDTGNKTGSNITVNLPKAVQDTIISKKIVNTIVVVDNPDIRIGMDLATVQEINKQAKSDVNIAATRTDSGKLTGDAKKAIGSRPVFDLKVNYGNGKAVSSFGAGSVSVIIPYTLGANEKAGNVQAVYVDAKGKVHWLTNSVYDSAEKVLRFSTNHFSTYGIGYKQANPAFTDIAGHWAKEDIEFVVSRGLFSGTSETKFSPNAAMTRGMFVTALGRLANADVSGYAKSSFSDVKSDAYYMGYIEWASKNNIVNGVGNGRFAPDQSITREQMAVIMSNYAKTIGYTLPKVHVENIFADNGKISAYAKEAVKQMQMAGVISGKNGNLFDPQGTATRAEVSAVLRRFVELAISSDTAQGWTMNDSGKWMYFKDGKPLTGKQDIDGGAYTFDQYGVTADVPKNLRYTTYIVQKGDSFWLIAHKLGCTMSELERLNNKSRFSIIYPGDVLRVPEK